MSMRSLGVARGTLELLVDVCTECRLYTCVWAYLGARFSLSSALISTLSKVLVLLQSLMAIDRKSCTRSERYPWRRPLQVYRGLMGAGIRCDR
jgi:hypothetical protein